MCCLVKLVTFVRPSGVTEILTFQCTTNRIVKVCSLGGGGNLINLLFSSQLCSSANHTECNILRL